MIVLFKLEVAILKKRYNIASSNINLTLKVTGRHAPFSLRLTHCHGVAMKGCGFYYV